MRQPEVVRSDGERRDLAVAGALSACAGTGRSNTRPVAAWPSRSASRTRPNPIGVSTYSFWQFRHADLRDIETCFDLAAEMGFDGVEILHRQMADDLVPPLRRLMSW